MKILFDKEIKAAAPDFKVLVLEADIENGPTSDALWSEITAACEELKKNYPIEAIRHRPAIAAIREAYKRAGKDPNRYRPSSEALSRRAVKGLDLYRTLSVIDLINLISLQTGHSIGAFDADKIEGDTLTLGVGAEGEPYQAIGRGELNIAGLPVYRDNIGGIGTPTSDNDRTKLSEGTRRLLVTFNIYGDDPAYPLEVIESELKRLLSDYAAARNITTNLYRITNEDN